MSLPRRRLLAAGLAACTSVPFLSGVFATGGVIARASTPAGKMLDLLRTVGYSVKPMGPNADDWAYWVYDRGGTFIGWLSKFGDLRFQGKP